jgi:acetylornithine/N-succinyldiaminopimelate aminotransferase
MTKYSSSAIIKFIAMLDKLLFPLQIRLEDKNMTTSLDLEVQNDKDTSSLMYIVDRPDNIFVRGDGMWLYDDKGNKYLDYLQGWAVNCLGHSHPAIVEALTKQAQLLINPSPAFYNAPMIDLSKLLTSNSHFNKVFFANTGAEANEGAIKLSRKWGQKHKNGAFEIITFLDSFHGRTLATMSASGKAGFDSIFPPKIEGFVKAEFNNLDSVKKLINSNTVGIMLEPIQGESGVVPATTQFMQGLELLCKEHNILLICDEVQSGCGRSGHLFAHQISGVKPHIMTLGKGIGGGVPLAALLAIDEVSCFEAGDQGGTYNGNPLMTSVGVAVLETLLQDGFLESVKQKGQYLADELNVLVKEFNLVCERGEGLLRALVLSGDYAKSMVTKAKTLTPYGVLLNAPRPNILRFMPSLTVSYEELDLLINTLRELLKAEKV